jgi:hypothetical protein
MGALALSGCATTYGPAGFAGGYTDSQLAHDTFSVSFNGNAWVSGQKAADLALLRAAELASESGYPYFVILQSNNHANVGSYTGTPTTNLITGQVTPGSTTVFSKPGSTLIVKGLRRRESNSLNSDNVVSAMKMKYGI